MFWLTRRRQRAEIESATEKPESPERPKIFEGPSGRRFICAEEIEICKRADGNDWVLGSGSFGKVYKGLRHGVQEVAIKKMLMEISEQSLRSLKKEINVLQLVSYDRNVVQYYGACLQDQASPMLVMEYMAVRSCSSLYMTKSVAFCLPMFGFCSTLATCPH